ncbi:hypothetical protein AB0H49_00940 [Nocardia sp. NPDC050713]|uniref:hypothetical protein n=1 Tax=Nocardia sp. NPDC050713 TaxID=3154511 RepID=UPI0033D65164
MLLGQARPTHDAALSSALGQAAAEPELAPLVAAVEALNTSARGARMREYRPV